MSGLGLAVIGALPAGAARTAGKTNSPAALLTGFDDNTLAANDDGSTGLVTLPFTIDFFGSTFSSLYVNNNGNVTFDEPLGNSRPAGSTPSIARLSPPSGPTSTRPSRAVVWSPTATEPSTGTQRSA
jgi:hypothetical protein